MSRSSALDVCTGVGAWFRACERAEPAASGFRLTLALQVLMGVNHADQVQFLLASLPMLSPAYVYHAADETC